MPMFLFLLFVIAVVAFVATRKSAQPLKPLVSTVKKVEEIKVQTPEVKEEVVVKKTRKPRAKKTTPKKTK
jgi:hypothetical protein